MDSCDHDAARHVFEFFMQVKSTDRLPRPMLDKAICAVTFVERAKQVGSRPMYNNYFIACPALPLPR